MFLFNLKVVLRVIRRAKGYAVIQIAGLAVGLAAALLILLWVADELSFDRFHEKAPRIHRVCVDYEAGAHMRLALSMPEFATAAVRELPGVEQAARISRPERVAIRCGDREFYENLVCYADNSLFQVFSLPFISGDLKTALIAPHSLVLTKATAEKYFGDRNPIGEVVHIGGTTDYTVSGVVEDVPGNSHFRFHAARSFETLYAENRRDMENWLNIQYYAYLLLAEGADPQRIEAQFPSLIERFMGETLRAMGGSLVLFLQPLTRIHLHSDVAGDIAPQGDILYVYLFLGAALFILILAGINFINLSTARAAVRAREIGMKKILGSSKKSLVRQFLGEAFFYSLMSAALALLLTALFRPLFSSLLGRTLSFDPVRHPSAALGFAGMTLAAGLLAGSYPAFFLSSLSPLRIFKGGPGAKAAGRRFRNGLVVFQFCISMILLIGTLTVFRQIRFMKSKDLGFDPERILVIPEVQDLLERISFESVRKEMLEAPGVTAVAGSALVPTRGIQHAVFYPEGSSFEQPQKFTRLDIEPGYIPAMKIKLVEGRNFSLDFPTDPAESMLINESLARALGWTDPLGKTFFFRAQTGSGESVTVRRVIGVVKDFHFASLRQRIDPLVILDRPERIRFLTLRISAPSVPAAVESLGEKWSALNPRRPFDYFFLETAFNRLYGAEERMGGLTLGFSLLAVMIGCMGLFGLSAHTAERRTKEIGIRRVLGASSTGIFRLMSFDFLRLVLIAALLAWPAAYFGLSRWLNDFPYRVDVGWLVPVGAGFFALAVALITVGFQAVRAARADPVSALRYE